MFYGTHTPRLDEKGRLILPARFREELAAGTMISRWRPDCLYLHPLADFRAIDAQLDEAAATSTQAAGFARTVRATAYEDVPDKQGRIAVPASLRVAVGLDRDCAVIGNGSRVEVWALPAWQRYAAEQEETFRATTDAVLPGFH